VARAAPELVAFLGAAETLSEPADYARFDWQLHHLLTVRSGNPIYTLILNGFRGFYEEIARRYFAAHEARRLSDQFYADLRAARAADAAAKALARAVMRQYQYWSRELRTQKRSSRHAPLERLGRRRFSSAGHAGLAGRMSVAHRRAPRHWTDPGRGAAQSPARPPAGARRAGAGCTTPAARACPIGSPQQWAHCRLPRRRGLSAERGRRSRVAGLRCPVDTRLIPYGGGTGVVGHISSTPATGLC
jgi:hypothetical protein